MSPLSRHGVIRLPVRTWITGSVPGSGSSPGRGSRVRTKSSPFFSAEKRSSRSLRTGLSLEGFLRPSPCCHKGTFVEVRVKNIAGSPGLQRADFEAHPAPEAAERREHIIPAERGIDRPVRGDRFTGQTFTHFWQEAHSAGQRTVPKGGPVRAAHR